MAAELYVKRARRRFDYIFCDPPFPYQYKWELTESIAASVLMGEGSHLMLHRPREDYHDEAIPRLKKEDSREYGRSVVDFFVHTP
jgi:16S rRNA G966 N2-methylase RsmD